MTRRALAEQYAIGYFESWNLESLQGVVDAAEQTRSPIIIGFNGDFLSRADRLAEERLEWYAALGKAAAASASVPCALIFNECPRHDWVRRAVALGFNLVVPVRARSAHEDFTRSIAELTSFAHEHGVAVEAEIDDLPSAAPGENPALGQVTDPARAAAFVRATDVDLLAVSVGNVHVMLDRQSGLDLDRLAAIHKAVPAGLVLHGGTGIDPESLRKAPSLGVIKVNFGSCLKLAYLDALRRALRTGPDSPHRLLGFGDNEDVMVAARLAVRNAVLEKIEYLGSCGKAWT